MTDDEQKKIFQKNLLKYLNQSNKKQNEVAKAIGVSPQTFNTWCQGIAIPRMGKIQLLADYFHIGKSDLVENKIDSNITTKKAVSINVLGRVAAGIPLNAIEYIIDTEEIPEDLAKTGYFFGLKIKGNSMEPEIKNNDVVIVRQQEEAESGDIVIAMVNGDDAVCKRLKLYSDKLALISINSEYDPMIFSNDDIEQKPVKIIGKVVEIRRKL